LIPFILPVSLPNFEENDLVGLLLPVSRFIDRSS
jgi:hypothetical protein